MRSHMSSGTRTVEEGREGGYLFNLQGPGTCLLCPPAAHSAVRAPLSLFPEVSCEKGWVNDSLAQNRVHFWGNKWWFFFVFGHCCSDKVPSPFSEGQFPRHSPVQSEVNFHDWFQIHMNGDIEKMNLRYISKNSEAPILKYLCDNFFSGLLRNEWWSSLWLHFTPFLES